VARLYNDSFVETQKTNVFQAEGSGSFDSYLRSEADLIAGEGLTSLRLLTVDNHLFLPAKRQVRARVTSTDVLHC